MRAIVLAAGFGERTRGTLGDTPKVLIKTADGRTILDHITHDLSQSGVREVSIVTNAKFFGAIENAVQGIKSNAGISVINDNKSRPEERLGALGDLLFAIDLRGGRSRHLGFTQ